MIAKLQKLLLERSSLSLDPWLQYNEEKWGYRAERVLFQRPDRALPKLEGVFYLDKGGHIVLPPGNPYLSLQFTPSPTEQPYRLYTQWLEMADMLTADILKRGFRGNISFPPGFIDGRSFFWKNHVFNIRYTFLTELPIHRETWDASVRKNINKALRCGYLTQRSNDWEAIIYCLTKTEAIKGFSYNLTTTDLTVLDKLLGRELFRGYLCLTPEGEPVGAQIKLFLAGGISIDWVAGTDRDHIKNGVNQLLYQNSCDDMAASGGHYFDLCGANIRSVAQAKATWGWPLIPYLTLQNDGLVHRVFRNFIPSSLRPALRKLITR